jgi:NTP pyrophosphatase (non-canonical NTP hydrolase)
LRDTARRLPKLGEEYAELVEAIHRYREDPRAQTRHAVMEEMADVVIVLTAIAGRLGLSLDHAVRRKFEDNLRRSSGEGKPIKD